MRIGMIVFGLCVVVISGCNSKSQQLPADGIVVTGDVSWKGKPLKWGNFILEDITNKANSVSADITEGKFTIIAERRLKPGTYRVMIFGGSRAEDNPETAGPATTNEPNKETLQAEHNERSVVKVEIKATGTNHLKYDLK